MPLNIDIEVQGCETLTLETNDAPFIDSVVIDDAAGLGDTDVTWSADKSAIELADKVDKEAGESLVSDTEIEKLSTVEQYATTNRPDAQNADKEHTHTISDVTGLDAALETKVDKVEGYSLVDDDEIDKLSTIEQYAQKNLLSSVAGKQGDVLLDKEDVGLSEVDNTADADKPVSTAVADALDDKVDKVIGKQLSTHDLTDPLYDKLVGLDGTHWRGAFVSVAALEAGVTDPQAGDYADVDVDGEDVQRYIWDASDAVWVVQSGAVAPVTAAQVKQLYESNPDTNAFTQAEKTKLSGIASEATKNRDDSENADKEHTHTISDVTGLSDRLDSIDALIGDVEAVLIAINGEP